MKNSGKIIGTTLAVAGIVTYLLCTKKGKKLKCNLKEKGLKIADEAEEKLKETKENFKESLADKVFDFAVNNRQTLASATSLILPYLLKNMVKKKL